MSPYSKVSISYTSTFSPPCVLAIREAGGGKGEEHLAHVGLDQHVYRLMLLLRLTARKFTSDGPSRRINRDSDVEGYVQI
jgi:hypothetical protein